MSREWGTKRRPRGGEEWWVRWLLVPGAVLFLAALILWPWLG